MGICLLVLWDRGALSDYASFTSLHLHTRGKSYVELANWDAYIS